MIGWVHARLLLPDPRADAFWAAALGWRAGAPRTDDPLVIAFEPPDGDSYLDRRESPGEPAVQVRLEVADLAAEADRLISLGATRGSAGPAGAELVSPGGWPFSLIPQQRHRRPGAPLWPGGQRSRLVQICIDSPAPAHEREVTFWTEATGWPTRATDSPEFGGKLVLAGASVQFLLHRIGADDEGTAVRAHLDLGSDDREAEVARLVELGAVRRWAGDGWVTLTDPAGMLFCVAGISPDAP